MRIKRNNEKHKVSYEKNENHKNLRIPCDNPEKLWKSHKSKKNNENHENPRNACAKHETHWKYRIPLDNQDNHENLRISYENH